MIDVEEKELADKSAFEYFGKAIELVDVQKIGLYKDGFYAGLKAGRPQWHDLRKDPTDLPKDKHDIWCKWLDQYSEGWYDKDTNTWTLIYKGYHLHCIEAWCELPTFDKE